MDLDLVIKNGEVVTALERFRADVGVRSGKIVALAGNLAGDREIDADGLLVLPGALDVHTHLQLPFCGTISADDFENGTKAAACGGITAIIDFAIQTKGNTIMDAVRARREEADGKVCIDYGLHAAITDWNEEVRKELATVIDYGIPSFKMFMIYRKEGWMADDGMLYQALEETADLGGIIEVHAESAFVLDMLIDRYLPEKEKVGAYGHVLSRPNFVEYEAIQRGITWADATGGTLYIVHMSTGEGADMVKQAREFGIDVYAETCPQYLVLDDEVFKGERGYLYATCPQIKKKEDSERLWEGLRDGEVQVIATDTCTFTTEQKAMWEGDFTKIPFGLPGVETMFPLLYSEGVAAERISLNRLVAVASTNPAKLFGLYPEKGTIQVGSDADLVIYDPNGSRVVTWKELQTNCDWSPYEGWTLKGAHRYTLLRGEVVAEKGRWVGRDGGGCFVKGKPGGSLE